MAAILLRCLGGCCDVAERPARNLSSLIWMVITLALVFMALLRLCWLML
jgi:hypothetical protein